MAEDDRKSRLRQVSFRIISAITVNSAADRKDKRGHESHKTVVILITACLLYFGR